VTGFEIGDDMDADRDTGFAVGVRVRLTDATHAAGEIVEDFGALAGTAVVIDAETTARSRRWAVRLDDGRLAFADDGDLEPA
jgi:hypothetical protein